MKHIALLIVALVVTTQTFAKGGSSGGSHRVSGYTKRDGTYVQPHRATDRDSTTKNNWSHKGNTNPYTGKPGTKND